MHLVYRGRIDIEDEETGLTEPSGLAMADDGRGLWTVSDDTKRVFCLDLEGRVKGRRSFKVPVKDLEGITTDGGGAVLYAVEEGPNRILKLNIESGEVLESRCLSEMAGYNALAEGFAESDDNKGLEGIAWDGKRQCLFVVKEGDPCLLIELAADLASILSHRELGAESGFVDEAGDDAALDLSGLCYDPRRERLWVLSHQLSRVFLYNVEANRAEVSFPLTYTKGGKEKPIKQAEGVALSPDGESLYIVCDRKTCLYRFEIEG
ncbi:MAG: SdiA-regulated domain-containing protein [Planctomycetota bacterium]